MMPQTIVRLATATIEWRIRNGGVATMTFQSDGAPLDMEYIIAATKQAGHPGHNGARWRYWLDDIKSALSRPATA